MSDESAKMKEGNLSLTLYCKSSICEEQKMEEGGNSIRLDNITRLHITR